MNLESSSCKMVSLIVSLSLSLILSVCFITPATAHTMGLGDCPRVLPMKDFEMDKLLGEWFVIQKVATSSSCMRYNFTIGPNKVMRLIQTKQHFVLDRVGVDHLYSYAGVLTVPEPSIPSKMRVKFPLNIAGEADYIIYATDYSNYAGIFTCQKILFGHTRSATILSRKSTLDDDSITLLRKMLGEQGVDVEDLNVVSQDKCITRDESNLNFKIDDKTFGVKKLAGTIKDMGELVGAGIAAVNTIKGVTRNVQDAESVATDTE